MRSFLESERMPFLDQQFGRKTTSSRLDAFNSRVGRKQPAMSKMALPNANHRRRLDLGRSRCFDSPDLVTHLSHFAFLGSAGAHMEALLFSESGASSIPPRPAP